MKKIKLILIISFLIFSLSENTFSQNNGKFSGTITYTITYPKKTIDPAAKAMLPKTMSITIKDMMMKTEISTAMVNTIQIINTEDNTGYQLLDIMGQKYAIETTAKDLEKNPDVKDVVIKYLDERKIIAGLECKKAEIKYKYNEDNETKIFVFYTDKLDSKSFNILNPLFKDIKGVLMEYIVEGENDVTMKYTVSSINKRKVSKNEFDIPKDYKITSQDKFKTMFGD